MSTTKYVIPLWASASGSVRARRMPYCATWASVVHTFWPFTTNSSPSRSARVVSDARSLPAPGSLKSWHQISVPSSSPGRYRACCSSVPATISVGAAQPIPIGFIGRGASTARSSSSITSCSIADAPRPHGRGQCGATYPASASRRVKSAGKVPPGAASARNARTSAR